jgi:hypothetical protein
MEADHCQSLSYQSAMSSVTKYEVLQNKKKVNQKFRVQCSAKKSIGKRIFLYVNGRKMSLRAVNVFYCYHYCFIADADDYVTYQPVIIAICTFLYTNYFTLFHVNIRLIMSFVY